MQPFDFTELAVFFQVAIALNLAPSLSSGIFDTLMGFISVQLQKTNDSVSLSVSTKINHKLRGLNDAEKNYGNILNLDKNPELKENLKKHADLEMHAHAVNLNSIIPAFEVLAKEMYEDFEFKIKEDKYKIKTSFICSAIFSMFLILYPLVQKMTLSQYCIQNYTYGLWVFIACFLLFQCASIFIKHKSLPFVIFLIAIVTNMVVMAVFINRSIPICEPICSNSYIYWTIIITLIMSMFSFLFFPIKYYIDLIRWEKKLNTEYYKLLISLSVDPKTF